MYTDTKKSYEQIVQTNSTDPKSSSLNLKLRIQKDRLVAWGLEWADSNAGQSDDIDSSLDRAGISDLVASIMSSIKELLDEAERMQPQPRQQPPGSYPVDKAGILLGSGSQWTSANLIRLDDIVRDLTASIDTLCDLSRSQQALRQVSNNQAERLSPHSNGFKDFSSKPALSRSKTDIHQSTHLSRTQSDLIASSRIDPLDLIYPTKPQLPTATPPSYNSTAADPGNRLFAFLRSTRQPEKIPNSNGQYYDRAVLVDYYSEDCSSPNGPLPSLQRFEDLLLSLQGSSQDDDPLYTGSLKIIGWFADPHNARYAFVYELPQPQLLKTLPLCGPQLPPQSLLSYLQHSGDTDSSNVPHLEDRFRLALNIVTNLLHIHAKGLTHRNINSNNIVFVGENSPTGIESKPWKDGIIRKPFLVSWDQCVEDTPITQPETLISNIYRPPGIERGQRSAYRPAHDIYSLGLVLLEIGLWMPLNKLWKTKYARSDFKARLQAIYAKKLAAKCGSAYMGVVEYCLRAVDEDSQYHSPRDPISRGQNEYYWNVLKPLERCCAMDSLDEPRVSAFVAHHPTSETRPDSYSIGYDNASNPKNFVNSSQVFRLEQPEWKARQGFSPDHPRGIELQVWRYGVDEDLEKHYETNMAPKICWLANRAIPIQEGIELSTFMSGPNRDTARPTLVMTCKSLRAAWQILNYVNKDENLFDIYVSYGQLRRSKAKRKHRRKGKKTNEAEDKPGHYPTRYQQKPSCGASIGCFVDEQHSEAVTFGGIVLVDGEAHGMSVHHMLEDTDCEDDYHNRQQPLFQQTPDLDFGFDDPAIDMPDPLTELDNLPEGFDALEICRAEAEGETNDLCTGELGIKPGEGEPIIVTQPALDDVDPNYFPSEDEMSDDHLVIHGLGTIHASSGLRQTRCQDVAHEIDWALFKIHNDRLPTVNAVDGGIKHCEKAAQEFFPSQVLKADALANLNVHSYGSTSGLQAGTIRNQMELTRMPGRRSFSPVWKFEGDFGVGGDSGAWIIDNKTGGLCGHVSSYSESQQYGVLAPMEAQLHDMEETLRVKVALPAPKKDTSQSFRDQIVDVTDARPKFAKTMINIGSDDGSDSDHEEEQSVASGSPPSSPEMATSPASLSRQKSTLEPLSLDAVAEKWQSAQASKPSGVEKKNSNEGKRIDGTVRQGDGAVKVPC